MTLILITKIAGIGAFFTPVGTRFYNLKLRYLLSLLHDFLVFSSKHSCRFPELLIGNLEANRSRSIRRAVSSGPGGPGGSSPPDDAEGPDEEQRAALQRIRRRMERERLAKDRYDANSPVSSMTRAVPSGWEFQQRQSMLEKISTGLGGPRSIAWALEPPPPLQYQGW